MTPVVSVPGNTIDSGCADIDLVVEFEGDVLVARVDGERRLDDFVSIFGDVEVE